MPAEQAPTYQERLQQTTENLRQNGEGAFAEAVELFRDLQREGSEKLSDLKEEISEARQVVEGIESTSEVVTELKDLMSSVHSELADLSSTIEQSVAGAQGEERWYQKLFGKFENVGDIYNNVTTNLAFSFGGILKQAKESGFFQGKLLQPIMSLIGTDKIELANALQTTGFEGIDASDGNFNSIRMVLKTRPELKGTDMETFAALIAQEARKRYPGTNTLTYVQLEDIAKTLTVPSAKSQPKQAADEEAQSNAPEQAAEQAVSTGDLLKKKLDIAGQTVSLTEQGVFTVSGNTWQLKLPENGVVQQAVMSTENTFTMAVSVKNNRYEMQLDKAQLEQLVTTMTNEKKIEQQVFVDENGAELPLDIVPTA